MSMFERQLVDYSEPLEVVGPLQELVEALQFHTQHMRLGPLVIPLLRLVKEDSSIVQQLALQALNLVFDINPQHIQLLHHEDALSSLCALVLAATDQDLTEQALKCLKLACSLHANAILEEGGIRASLAYFSYWNTSRLKHFQKTALQLCSTLIERVYTYEHLLQLWSVLPTFCEAFENGEQAVRSLAGDCLLKIFQTLQTITPSVSKSKRTARNDSAGDRASSAQISYFVQRAMQTRIARMCSRHCFGAVGNTHQEQRHLCWQLVQAALQFDIAWLVFDTSLLQAFMAAVNRCIGGLQYEELNVLPPALEAGLDVFPAEGEAADLLQQVGVQSLMDDPAAIEQARQTVLSSSDVEVSTGIAMDETQRDHQLLGQEGQQTLPQANWSCVACTFLNAADRMLCEICETPNPSAPQGMASGTCPWAGMLPIFNDDELGEPEQSKRTSRPGRTRTPRQPKSSRTEAYLLSNHGLVVVIAETLGPALLRLFVDDQMPLKLRLRILQFVRVLQLICPEVLVPTNEHEQEQEQYRLLRDSVPRLLAGLCSMLANVQPSDLHDDNVQALTSVLHVTLAFASYASDETKDNHLSLLIAHGLVSHLRKILVFNHEQDLHSGQPRASRRGRGRGSSRSVASPASLVKDILVALLEQPVTSPKTSKTRAKKRPRSSFHTMSHEELVAVLEAIPASPSLQQLRNLNEQLSAALRHAVRLSSTPHSELVSALQGLSQLVHQAGTSTSYELQASGLLNTLRNLLTQSTRALERMISSVQDYCTAKNAGRMDQYQIIARALLDALFDTNDVNCNASRLARMIVSSVPVKAALPLITHSPSKSVLGTGQTMFRTFRLEVTVYIPGYEAINLTGPVVVDCHVEPVSTLKEFRDKLKQSVSSTVEKMIICYKQEQMRHSRPLCEEASNGGAGTFVRASMLGERSLHEIDSIAHDANELRQLNRRSSRRLADMAELADVARHARTPRTATVHTESRPALGSMVYREGVPPGRSRTSHTRGVNPHTKFGGLVDAQLDSEGLCSGMNTREVASATGARMDAARNRTRYSYPPDEALLRAADDSDQLFHRHLLMSRDRAQQRGEHVAADGRPIGVRRKQYRSRAYVRARLPILAPEEQTRFWRYARRSMPGRVTSLVDEGDAADIRPRGDAGSPVFVQRERTPRDEFVLDHVAMEEDAFSEDDYEENEDDEEQAEESSDLPEQGLLESRGAEEARVDLDLFDLPDSLNDLKARYSRLFDQEQHTNLDASTTPVRRAERTSATLTAPDSLGSPDPVRTVRISDCDDELAIRRRGRVSMRAGASQLETFSRRQIGTAEGDLADESPKRRRVGLRRAAASGLESSAYESDVAGTSTRQSDSLPAVPCAAPKARDVELAHMQIMAPLGEGFEQCNPYTKLDLNELPNSMTMAECIQIISWARTELNAGRNPTMCEVELLHHRQTTLSDADWESSFSLQISAGTTANLTVAECNVNEQAAAFDADLDDNITDAFSGVVLLGQLTSFCQLLSRVIAVGPPTGWHIPPAHVLQAVVEECKLPNLTRQFLLQQQDVLVQTCCLYPQWFARLCSDPLLQPLIPFDARLRVAQNLAIGRSRRIAQVKSLMDKSDLSNMSHSSMDRLATLGEPTRQKVLLRRDKVLHDGQRLFKRVLNAPSALPARADPEAAQSPQPFVIGSQESARGEFVGNFSSSDFVPIGQQRMVWPQVPDSTLGTGASAVQLTDSLRERCSSSVMIEFQHERGHGEGPTQEFYTLFCRDIMSRSIPAWQTLEDHSQIPARTQPEEYIPGNIKLYRVIGYLLGKAMQDSRLLDLRLHATVINVMMGKLAKQHSVAVVDKDTAARITQPVYNFVQMEPVMWRSLSSLLASSDDELAALDFSFVFPGSDELELCKGGSSRSVTTDNVCEFLQRVVDFACADSVTACTAEMMRGMAEFIPLTAISCLQAHDVQHFITSPNDEMWDAETILACIDCKHGYTSQSRQVQDLVTVMSEFDPQQRMHFLQFVTGAPRLPMLGFRGLQPPMTVVKKEPLAGVSANDTLPSCSTCQVYFKLPEYSCKEALRSKVLQAITEGREYFALD